MMRRGCELAGAFACLLILFAAPLAARAQGIAALTLNPTTIAGGSGASAIGKVTLSGPAPAGGTVVTLSSSNIALAASKPSVTVAEGATSATFTVATNPHYRSSSRLSFTVAISASANGSSASANLTVSAQPLPPNPTTTNGFLQGLMCGPLFGGQPSILYQCSQSNPPSKSLFGPCTFRQECLSGCKIGPATNKFNDSCSTNPLPVALDRTVTGGDRAKGALLFNVPPPAGSVAAAYTFDPNATVVPPVYQSIPVGATSIGFEVATSYVPSIEFVPVIADVVIAGTPRVFALTWLTVVPPDPPPPVALPTLADFNITGTNPVAGGHSASALITLSGVSPGGGPIITLSSSHPEIASLPPTVAVPAGGLREQVVQITTNPPPVDTAVTLTATDGRYAFSSVLTVLVPPPPPPPTPPPLLSAVSTNPTTVVGGNTSTGTITLSAPAPSGGAVVFLSTPLPAVALLPATVTVPAGATSATFTIPTTAVTGTFTVNVFAALSGTTRTALLLVTPPPITCTPTTCAAQGKNCGTISDGCGGTLVCGSCAAPQTCGGGGVANVCGLSTASTALLTVTATGRAGESISSTPVGLNVNVGATGSASFTTATSVTLSVSNGRSAIWSGGCSSAGARVKSCTFTINAATSVTANVQ